MNKLSTEERKAVIGCLVEGNSIRATVRLTGVAKNTVVKLLRDLGRVCLEYQDMALRDLPCKRVQCDEIWTFVYAKEKNCPVEQKEKGGGDVWTWVAIDADTKLVPCWYVGQRNIPAALHFLVDLRKRMRNRVQITTDQLNTYLNAVPLAFRGETDFAMLMKIYGGKHRPERIAQERYSPGICIGTQKAVVCGNPEQHHISTSYVERQNLTMRMSMRRFTRLTNAFSKKIENLKHALALHYMNYNFCRIHQKLRVTPAMEASVSDHVWSLEEVIALLG